MIEHVLQLLLVAVLGVNQINRQRVDPNRGNDRETAVEKADVSCHQQVLACALIRVHSMQLQRDVNRNQQCNDSLAQQQQTLQRADFAHVSKAEIQLVPQHLIAECDALCQHQRTTE